MKDSCIISSASNKFFPSLLNLIGSIKKIHPDHPPIYVYDLGLWYTFRKELAAIEGVTVVDMPHFVPFWRACYTWKTHIFTHPFATLNLYLDAGTEVIRPLTNMFQTIDVEGYFAVYQGVTGAAITPQDYMATFQAHPDLLTDFAVTAGIFGFKKDGAVAGQLNDMYRAASEGYCLGFSAEEQWKNKGVNKTSYVRDCPHFRHDTTLLNLFLRKGNPTFHAHDAKQYAGWTSPTDHPQQVIWNVRMNYKTLDNLSLRKLYPAHAPLVARVNRAIIAAFFTARNARLKIKGK